MPKYNFLQNALIGGEVTPLARGRSDVAAYRNSLEDCENMIPFAAGGAGRRPGTTYLNKVGSTGAQLNLGGATDRFIPWEISDGTRLMVCLGGSATLKVINLNTNALLTVSNNSVTYALSASVVGTLTTAQAKVAQYVQVADTMFIVSADVPPIRLSYASGAVAMLGPWDGGGTYQTTPYLPVNTTAITLASSNTALGATTVTASAAFFTASHVGAWFKFGTGAINITGFTSSTSVAGVIYDVLASGAATTAWEQSAWSDYQGWPRACGFFQARLVYGGTTRSPDSLWFSQDSDVYEFSTAFGVAAAATDPFSVTPNNAEKVAKINWLVGGTQFAFGTEREEFTVTIPDSSAGLSVSNIQITKQTSRGSKHIQAVRIESVVYFVDASGQRIVELVFDLRENGYRNKDINIFADHLFAKFQEMHSSPRAEKVILSICKTSDKDQRLWVLDEDGGLYSCVIDRMYDIQAWSMHYLGGNGTDDDTDPVPFIKTICPVNNTGFTASVNTGHDILWLMTTRSIANSSVNYIEYIDRAAEDQDDYMDCKITLSQASSTTVTGLEHLASETVSVVADGLYVGEKAVTAGGVVTLSVAATAIKAGFKYKSRLKTLPIDAGSQIGSALGSIGRIDQARIGFYRTANASVGSVEQDDDSNLDEVLFRPVTTPTNQAIPLFTGYKVLDIAHDYEREQQIVIETQGPLAMTVTHITLRGQTYD